MSSLTAGQRFGGFNFSDITNLSQSRQKFLLSGFGKLMSNERRHDLLGTKDIFNDIFTGKYFMAKC